MGRIVISEQTLNNECGICVAKTLIKYFHKRDISKEELWNKIKINENGISIFDFEHLLNIYGVKTETFEISNEEIINNNINEIFVTLISNQEGLHYVIVKKNKNEFIVYDSEKGKYSLKKDEFLNVFQNIIIFCSKKDFFINSSFNFKKILNIVDWRNFLINNILNLLYVFLTIISSTYINKLLSNVINNELMSNLISINIIFLINFITQNFINFFITLFSYNNKIDYLKFIYYKTIQSIISFSSSNINKYNTDDIIGIKEHVDQLSNFYTISLNKALSDCLSILVSVIILSINNQWFILLIVFFTFFILLFNYLSYCLNKHIISKSVKYENLTTESMFDIISCVKKQHNYYQLWNIKNKINYLHYKTIKFDKKNNKKLSIINLLFSTNTTIFFVLFISINIISILNKSNTTGKMFFNISLLQLYVSSLSNIFNQFTTFPKVKYSYELISRIINENNQLKDTGIVIEKVSEIKVGKYILKNDTLIKGNNGVGKTTLLKSIFDKNNFYNDVLINGIDLEMISSQWIKQNIIYINNEYVIDEETILKLLNGKYRQAIINVLKISNISSIKNLKELSTGQKQIITFISLLQFENKVLLIDELLSNVQKNIKFYLNSEIKSMITKHNFLISIDHDRNVINKYQNCLEVLNEKNIN